MHHAIVFNYFESGTQASDILDMSQFNKISMTKCSHREHKEKLLGFLGSDRPNTPYRYSKHAK